MASVISKFSILGVISTYIYFIAVGTVIESNLETVRHDLYKIISKLSLSAMCVSLMCVYSFYSLHCSYVLLWTG